MFSKNTYLTDTRKFIVERGKYTHTHTYIYIYKKRKSVRQNSFFVQPEKLHVEKSSECLASLTTIETFPREPGGL